MNDEKIPPKAPAKPSATGHDTPGRVDESLVRSHKLRMEVRNTLSRHDSRKITVEQLQTLVQELNRKGPEVFGVLVDELCTGHSRSSDMAFLLLTEMDEGEIRPRLEHWLLHQELLADRRVRVQTLLAALSEGFPHAENSAGSLDPSHETPGDLLGLAGEFWNQLEPIEAALLWVEISQHEQPEIRNRLLEVFLESGERNFLPIFQTELERRDAVFEQRLASALQQFPFLETRHLLQRLLAGKSAATTAQAGDSLRFLQTNHPALFRFNRVTNPIARKAGGFYRAFLAEESGSKSYCVVYARRRGKTGPISYCGAQIDTRQCGLVDIWGQINLTFYEFDNALLRSGFGDFAGLTFQPTTRDFAIHLLSEAEAFSRRKFHPIPPQFAVWKALYEADLPPRGIRYPIMFGAEP